MSVDFTLEPIGFVSNEVKEPPGPDYPWASILSEITVRESLAEALDGLEGFSHIIVLYWMHRLPRGRYPVKLHPRARPELPLVGLFATRTPNRPNPIGKATVRLLSRSGAMLRVSGLDAIDGSPVLDIKPHIPPYDAPAGATAPEWSGR